jgi:hypothetical protein
VLDEPPDKDKGKEKLKDTPHTDTDPHAKRTRQPMPNLMDSMRSSPKRIPNSRHLLIPNHKEEDSQRPQQEYEPKPKAFASQ